MFQTLNLINKMSEMGFWSENGIPLNPGDQIELEDFESPDYVEVNWLINPTTGQSVQLRTPIRSALLEGPLLNFLT